MIKTIIFDNGGVFSATSSYIFLPKMKKFTKSSLRKMQDAYWELSRPLDVGKISERKFYEKFVKKIKFDCGINKLLKIRYSAIKRIPGTFEIMKRLKRDYRIAMLNNEYKECMKFILKKYSYFEFFNQRITSCNVGCRKPEPEIFKIALKRLKARPQECLFIDDLKENTKAAGKFGIKTITFKNASQLRKELKRFNVKI